MNVRTFESCESFCKSHDRGRVRVMFMSVILETVLQNDEIWTTKVSHLSVTAGEARDQTICRRDGLQDEFQGDH